MAKIESKSSIKSPPTKVYNFFKSDLTQMTKIVPQFFRDVKVVDEGTVQYELLIFGDKITIKLKPERIDDAKRSITFIVLQQDKNEKNKAVMIKLNVNNGNITWSLQFVDSNNVSKSVTCYAKTLIDLIIKALDIYLQFSRD